MKKYGYNTYIKNLSGIGALYLCAIIPLNHKTRSEYKMDKVKVICSIVLGVFLDL